MQITQLMTSQCIITFQKIISCLPGDRYIQHDSADTERLVVVYIRRDEFYLIKDAH